MNRVLVIGLGNRLRGDDAAGPLVVEYLASNQPQLAEFLDSPGDSLTLINAWAGCEQVYLIDACNEPTLADGSIITIDDAMTDSSALAQLQLPTSSHVLDLPQAIALSQTLGNAPQRLTIYAIAGSHFGAGDSISTAVQAAVQQLGQQLLKTLQTTMTQPAQHHA